MTDKIITVRATLNCRIDDAFTYFSRNHLLTEWLTVQADVEMKEGGKYELFWTPDDPDPTNNSSYGCKVLSVDPPFYFNVEWMGNAEQKEYMNTVRPLTNVTVMFWSLDSEHTKVTLIHTGWRQGKRWEEARKFFTSAWQGAFNKLEDLIHRKNQG
jgi:hypothetical protein